MRYAVFSVPLVQNDEELDRLNSFLRGHKVIQVERQMVISGNSPCWTFCVEYLQSQPSAFPERREKKEKKDYRYLLSDEHFLRFSRMREIRRDLAREDAVPAYAVFTDAELAVLAQIENLDEKNMMATEGIGSKRMERYGMEFLKRLNEAGREPDR